MVDQKIGKGNEGEGSRSADRAYRAGTKDFIASGRVDKQARDAAKALDGPEGAELRRAEKAGKERGRGMDIKGKH